MREKNDIFIVYYNMLSVLKGNWRGKIKCANSLYYSKHVHVHSHIPRLPGSSPTFQPLAEKQMQVRKLEQTLARHLSQFVDFMSV